MKLQDSPVGPVIAVSDLETARPFYEGALGLAGEETPDGGRVLRAAGDTVVYLLAVGEEAGSAGWPVASFRVDDIGATVEELRARDVTFLGDADLPFDLDERGIAAQEGMAVARMRDPDGNILTIFSRDD